MNLFDQINADIKSAMKAKNKIQLEALRAVKATFILEKTKADSSELTDEVAVKIIAKLVKQRKDSVAIYIENDRAELAEKELAEIEFMQIYLPAQMSDEELTTAVAAIISKLGATSMKDMGKVMGAASKDLSGKAEGKLISAKVKALLA